MNSTKKFIYPWFSIAFAFLISLSLLLLPFVKVHSIPELIIDFGKIHPLVLHFPIAFILLVFVFELAQLYFSISFAEKYILVLLEAAALSGFFSVITGFLLNATGEYSGGLVLDHFMAGCITAALMWFSIGVYLIGRINPRFYALYSISLLASVLATAYTGHLGGSITHGKDYLPDYSQVLSSKPKDSIEIVPVNSLYHDVIAPILEMKCISCHNDLKAKGGLSIKTYTQLFKAGESNLMGITAGDALKSEIYNRIILPVDHKDHMPPEGKSPMTKDEIELIKYWIDSMAREDFLIQDTSSGEKINLVLNREIPRIQKFRKQLQLSKMEFGAIQSELDKIGKKIGVDFIKDHEEEGNLFVIQSKFPPSPFSNDQLYLLKPYLELFSKVSLISTAIDDDGLYYLAQMPNLKKLYLQKSKVNGSGLIYLRSLKQLEVLNLSFTKVDDQGAMFLMTFPENLKKVFLYRTKTSKEVADAVSKYKPGLNIILEEGPYN
ncbi:MAG: c-type cytochrome domain-containing protein [Saprospiraceae bacterium]